MLELFGSVTSTAITLHEIILIYMLTQQLIVSLGISYF